MINQLSDIKIGQQYHLFVLKDGRRSCTAVVHGIINEEVDFPPTGKTEIYLSIYQKGKWKSLNLFYASEIGLGETKEEAYQNYGRFRFDAHESFDKSRATVEARMDKAKVNIEQFRGLGLRGEQDDRYQPQII
ncbi:MAG: hypothetical protein ACOH13_12650 [Flavobacteriales bacterium]